MLKKALAALFLVVCSLPACARPWDVYPVSCNTLWSAVKDTIYSFPRDYGIQSMNNVEWRASFIVIGNLTVFTDHVELRTTDDGCLMKTSILEIGPDNADWRRFHKRVGRALDKMQATATPKATPEMPKATNPPS